MKSEQERHGNGAPESGPHAARRASHPARQDLEFDPLLEVDIRQRLATQYFYDALTKAPKGWDIKVD